MQGKTLFPDGIHPLDRRPEIARKALVASGQQIDVIQHPIVTIILHMLEAGSLRLDSHVDVFGNQTNKRTRRICAEPQRDIDNTIVIGLIFIDV